MCDNTEEKVDTDNSGFEKFPKGRVQGDVVKTAVFLVKAVENLHDEISKIIGGEEYGTKEFDGVVAAALLNVAGVFGRRSPITADEFLRTAIANCNIPDVAVLSVMSEFLRMLADDMIKPTGQDGLGVSDKPEGSGDGQAAP